ncbi:oligopeptide transporter [Bimuria novae-zelandiae CBS 107.79]|uniref:Oligopeptide transporter n=1 Tax=Bimuria novae-zelandiae CBS 107.79 TaxID=1447943 RepID=A0A6A5UIE4_9PLEO|nr:oligopeptide transporter [Bimuria novae-zelandiae CBS 107.79]
MGELGNQIEARVDPALIDGSVNPTRKQPVEFHQVEKRATVTPTSTKIVAEGGLPTKEELATLRRVPAKIPWRVYTIAFVELVERMSYYGTTVVFSNYVARPRINAKGEWLTTPSGAALHPGNDDAQPGALGMGKKVAQAITLFNTFYIYVCPMLGAWIADTYLGRFKTIVFSVMIAEVGHALLTGSAAPGMLDKPKNALALFIVGLLVMGLGTGMFKPNISPLIAEQIPQDAPRVEVDKKGQRVIVDPAETAARIYNWFYLFINVGALVGQLAMVYAERYVGFWPAFLIPTVFFLTTLPVLFFCRKMYIQRPPSGSVLGPAVKLPFLAMKGRWSWNPIRTWKNARNGSFWDSAKPSRLGSAKPVWLTYDDAWVDEVARGWAACGVLLWLPIYWLSYNQLSNNLIQQAATMSLHGIPNDLLHNLDPIAIIILVALLDLLVYPALRKAGIRFTPIKKIFTGFMLATAGMIWAAILQLYIYRKSPCGVMMEVNEPCKSDINLWAQTGIYVIIAMSEIMASVVSLEYAFTKAPKSMRSIVQAFSLFTSSISAALGEAFTPLSEDPHLVWNYVSVAIICFVAGWAFWFTYKDMDRDEDRLNMLPSGKHLTTPSEEGGDVESVTAPQIKTN